jgi:BASS family bile acid:Na+ symporter
LLQKIKLIHASQFFDFLLPIGLALVMLGMDLSLVLENFQRVTRYPKAVAVGLVGQLLFLPIISFLVAALLPMQPEIAVGLMVLALCPGGASSNIITYLVKGDVALSVTLTALSSTITVFTILLFTNQFLQYFMGQNVWIGVVLLNTISIAVGFGFGKLLKLQFAQGSVLQSRWKFKMPRCRSLLLPDC